MGTAVTMDRPGNRAYRLAKPLRYPDFLPGARIERRENRASFVLVLSGQAVQRTPVLFGYAIAIQRSGPEASCLALVGNGFLMGKARIESGTRLWWR